MLSNSPITLGIDLDGVIDEVPEFFATLTAIWPGKVLIISYRDNVEKAEADLASHNIRYDELILVSSFDAKAEVIIEKNVGLYIDDQPEMLKNVPPNVTVLLFRNEGNFDFESKLWIFSERTAKMV